MGEGRNWDEGGIRRREGLGGEKLGGERDWEEGEIGWREELGGVERRDKFEGIGRRQELGRGRS